MSGIEIVGLIAAIIEITTAIAKVFNAIKDLEGLPNAFQEVNKRLPIVEITLQSARTHAKKTPDDQAQALETLLDNCKDKANSLLAIFKQIDKAKGKPFLSVYLRLALNNGGKEGRVETLMGDIMKDVQALISYRVFQTATQSELEDLEKAIMELAQVEPSLPDSVFEEKAGSVNYYGKGDMFNVTGSGSLKQINGPNFEAAGDQNFGPVQYNYGTSNQDTNTQWLITLCPVDSHKEKERIEDTKGGLLRDSYSWVLDNWAFHQWHGGKQSRLLWMTGDPGKGKTMLLCGIINELAHSTRWITKEAHSSTLLSFFFCQGTDSRINTASAVLGGLARCLAAQEPLLIPRIRDIMKEYGHSSGKLFEGPYAWFALSKIFTKIL